MIKLIIWCCGRNSEEEDNAEAPKVQEMPIDPSKSKAKPKTYGKKTSKVPATPVIFAQPNTPTKLKSGVKHARNAPRDALSEITETFGNIHINVPAVNSPGAWIDPDNVSLFPRKGKGKEAQIPPTASATSKNLKKTLQSLKVQDGTSSLVVEGSTAKGEEDLTTPKTSLASQGSSKDRYVSNSTKGKGKEKTKWSKADSPASRRSQRVLVTRKAPVDLDNSSVRSKISRRSTDKVAENDPPARKADSPSQSVNTQISCGSSLDNSSVDLEDLRIRRTKAKGKGKEKEAEATPARNIASRGSSLDNSSIDLEKLNIQSPAPGSISAICLPQTPSRKRSALRYNEPKGLLSPTQTPDSIPDWLQPLVSAYNSGPRTAELTIQDWATVLGDVDIITKIAEASYAEVYRVEVANESSILKIITLKPRKGPGSKRYTAMHVSDVVSEFRIMDAMSEIDGYLELKDAYLVGGRPSSEMVSAHDKFRQAEEERKAAKGETLEWYFPNPASYQKETMFFVMEMVDAGKDLGRFHITGLVQVFDFFLQIALSLDAGERYYQFEHRDLHENNVCIRRRTGDPEKQDPEEIGGRYKLNYSGYDVTILDFTLSRATVGPNPRDVVCNNLEADLCLFQGEGLDQYQVYRDMRTHLFTKCDPSWYHDWSLYIPYTNVLWLRFIFDYMVDKYYTGTSQGRAIINSGGGWKQQEFAKRIEELEELRELLDGDAFGCAGNVVDYALMKGWIVDNDRL